jgi:hypothetical protein
MGGVGPLAGPLGVPGITWPRGGSAGTGAVEADALEPGGWTGELELDDGVTWPM